LQDNSDEDAFMLEKFASRLLEKRRHANILPLLAYFKHGSSFNMIFPYADCDLRTYYETYPPPKNPAERLQFMAQICKLTSALEAIHTGDPELQMCGYHGDLKVRSQPFKSYHKLKSCLASEHLAFQWQFHNHRFQPHKVSTT
jgi:hypothetical protein